VCPAPPWNDHANREWLLPNRAHNGKINSETRDAFVSNDERPRKRVARRGLMHCNMIGANRKTATRRTVPFLAFRLCNGKRLPTKAGQTALGFKSIAFWVIT
jgi:hypothetical protein